jgi:hypothetical protein
MKTAKQRLIIIALGAAVPRNAIGYVANLASSEVSADVEADSLAMLRRYCPALVARYVEASSTPRSAK